MNESPHTKAYRLYNSNYKKFKTKQNYRGGGWSEVRVVVALRRAEKVVIRNIFPVSLLHGPNVCVPPNLCLVQFSVYVLKCMC